MKTIKMVLGLSLMAMFISTADAQDDPQVDCSDAQTQMDMNYCAGQDFEKADAELNSVYQQAMESQKQVDKDSAEIDPAYVGAVQALRKAQRAWIDYRDGHCEGVGYEAVGGSMQPMLISGCKAGLTQTRTKELNDLIKGMGN